MLFNDSFKNWRTNFFHQNYIKAYVTQRDNLKFFVAAMAIKLLLIILISLSLSFCKTITQNQV